MSEVTTPVRASRFGPSALLTPANAVTLARLALVPVLIVVILARPVSWATASLAFVLAISDGFDGYIARRYGATRSGAFLDPLADKFLVLGALFALVSVGSLWVVPVIIIAARELAISLYRLYWGRQGLAVPARRLAKVKTFGQELAGGLAMIPATAGVAHLAGWVLWAAVVLTVVTGAQYLYDGRASATTMDVSDTA